MKITIRLLALFLIAVMAFSLAACDSADPATDPTTQTEPTTPKKPKDPNLEKIEKGIQMVMDANGFNFEFKMEQYGIHDGKEARSINSYYASILKLDNGEYSIAMKNKTTIIWGDERRENEGAWLCCYNGKVGYEYDGWGITKYESDEPFVPTQMLFSAGMKLDGNAEEVFCGFKPTVATNDDGSITYTKSNLNLEQYIAFMQCLTDEEYTEEDLEPVEQANISVTVDLAPNGCFQSLTISALGVPTDSQSGAEELNSVISFTVSNVGSAEEFVMRDLAALWTTGSNDGSPTPEYCWVTNGVAYTYERNSSSSWAFKGASAACEYYTVMTEIEGIPVYYVYDTENIQNIVIPAGVSFNPRKSYDYKSDTYYWSCKDTVVFFMDAEADVSKNFVVSDEYNEDIANVKGAYFAGQWELVDGVPTPKN